MSSDVQFAQRVLMAAGINCLVMVAGVLAFELVRSWCRLSPRVRNGYVVRLNRRSWLCVRSWIPHGGVKRWSWGYDCWVMWLGYSFGFDIDVRGRISSRAE